MLKKFSVSSYKSFDNKLTIDLTAGDYDFNENAIKNSCVKTGIIYGQNDSGKTNLIYAIMDITTHLTDFSVIPHASNHFINLNSKENVASFEYEFIFGNEICIYTYQKSNFNHLTFEKLIIGNDTIFEYSHLENESKLNLVGTETLERDLSSKNISFLKYLFKNAIYSNDPNYHTLNALEQFVEGMLTFSNLDRNVYQGFTSGRGSITEYIISNNRFNDFENFLKALQIDVKLVVKEIDGEKDIYIKYSEDKYAKFFATASKGTKALALFYKWLIDIENIKFLMIDEFDAFYHHELSKEILKRFRDTKTQTLVTTHNTSILTNDILRPDCYFNIVNKSIKSLDKLTPKELRKAHNIEKMYRSGAFENE